MPTVIIPEKICSHCGGNKYMMTKQKHNGKIYIKYQCLVKREEKRTIWRKSNPDKIKEQSKRAYAKYYNTDKWKATNSAYIEKNREKINATNKLWRDNSEKYRIKVKRKADKMIRELSDQYIKLTLTRRSGIAYSEVTPELIEIQRKSLKLQRELNLTNYGKKTKAIEEHN